ncbi:phage tail sheath family protein [Phenylobacterium immobile]|uniref:phage tail sheath family protein n=1 Tax=Phenylobacterium immobile TaxID=21 RepID=UPI000ACD53E2|nr:phage tail sheath subtilisin-like domain-containing protein [Phenylobacterium immobile]
MPEYLAPGVYIEETSYRAKSIEGVSTTTTGFVGPTRFGPVTADPDVITSLGEFERVYGGGEQLRFGANPASPTVVHNYMWHAARSFFAEGGRRLYVSRAYRRPDDQDYAGPDDVGALLGAGPNWSDGHARWQPGPASPFSLTARHPGAAGNIMLRLELRAGENVLGAVNVAGGKQRPVLGAIVPGDVIWIHDEVEPITSPPGRVGDLYLADHPDTSTELDPRNIAFWRFSGAPGAPISASSLTVTSPVDSAEIVGDPTGGMKVRVLTLTISAFSRQGEFLGAWANLPLDPNHRTGGAKDGFSEVFSPNSADLSAPFVAEMPTAFNGLDVVAALFGVAAADVMDGASLLRGIVVDIQLNGGSDGLVPAAGDYEGRADPEQEFKTGLKQFEAIDDISIVAAPGSTWNYRDPDRAREANTIISSLLIHAETLKYRIAVIDSAEGQTISDVRKMRAKIDSKYAAFYYPWVRVLDPITRAEIGLPPSGFVAGIYARNDIERAVFKAPANEVVRSAIGFEKLLNRSEQEVLNPEGINCFRFFPGRGFRLWGARLASSDPEWKYVNLRRYFAYLEHSIDKGTQWAVFEPNGELTWANVRRTIEDFLLNEWLNGALLGEKPERAYFVTCDRSTMSQNDLDNGRLVCKIGVAASRPAEFVVFRIGQWTGDRKV